MWEDGAGAAGAAVRSNGRYRYSNSEPFCGAAARTCSEKKESSRKYGWSTLRLATCAAPQEESPATRGSAPPCGRQTTTTTGRRDPDSVIEPRTTGRRRQRQTIDNRHQTTDDRHETPDNRQQQTTDSTRQQTTGTRQQTTTDRLITDNRQQDTTRYQPDTQC